MNSQKGFTIVEGLIIVVVIALIGLGGYTAVNKARDDETVENQSVQQETAQQEAPEESVNDDGSQATVPPSAPINKSLKSQYRITLPDGWFEEFYITARDGETHRQYTDNDGRTIRVRVSYETEGVGLAGDSLDATFSIIGDRFKLNDTYAACDPNGEVAEICNFGDGKLQLRVISEDSYKGDIYTFDLYDEKSEEQSAYFELKKIIETIQLR